MTTEERCATAPGCVTCWGGMMRRIGFQWFLPLPIQAAAKLLGWKRRGDTYYNGANFCVWYKPDDGIKVSMDAEPVEAGLDAALRYVAECEAKIPKDVWERVICCRGNRPYKLQAHLVCEFDDPEQERVFVSRGFVKKMDKFGRRLLWTIA